MKNIYLSMLIFVLLNMICLSANKSFGKNIFITANKTTEHISIDGKLSEQIWKSIPFSKFTQRDPIEGIEATEKTELWVAYDEHSLYVAAKMYDQSPDSIIGLLSRRDNFNDSDWFFFYLDSYNDKRTGYYFGVNAAGSISDGILFNDSWDDNSWNGIWESSVSKDNEGWVVEIKIPFTQIRFSEKENMEWGINANRRILRKNESSYLVMVPKNESGFVSHFATLTGLKDIKAKQRFELLPYLVTKAQYLKHDIDDPFYKSKQYSGALGLDFKMSLGSNLNLDATVNPDFGQVEVDPAVINLSAAETYYQEKRPFFIEGSNIFLFGYGGSNNNMGFNWGNPEIFYSRRIGRSPQISIDEDGFVFTPNDTRILGAGKVTGKIGDFSIGVITAATERTYSQINNKGFVKDIESEPFSGYSIVRVQKEMNDGKQGLGFIGTSVIRDLRNDALKDILASKSFVAGIDGWTALDDDGTYVLTGYFSGSFVYGSKTFITDLQSKYLHYLQRPDLKTSRIDSSAEMLSGYVGRITVNKQKGNFVLNGALGVASPGYEVNDLGFQWKADVINSHLYLGYNWFETDGIFRNKGIAIGTFAGSNFDGNITDGGIMLFLDAQLENYYGFYFNIGYNPSSYSPKLLRGGPLYKKSDAYNFNFTAYSDSRNKLKVNAYAGRYANNYGSYNDNYELNFSYTPSSTINFSFGPFIDINNQKEQWVTSVTDKYATSTYGKRYILSDMDQTTVGGNIRLNWTFTPTLSVQLFIQPLFSTGDYRNYKEVIAPREGKFLSYGSNNTTIEYNSTDNTYSVDPDGNGPASSFSFDKPDFNYKSIRGNIIVRWEFSPGSVFYLAWTHSKEHSNDLGKMKIANDFTDLMETIPDNIFMAKFSYWFDI